MQSPKSQRPKAPGERPSSDNNSETESKGHGGHSGTSGQSANRVPKLDGAKTGLGGSPQTANYSPRPTGPASKPQGGGPGYVDRTKGEGGRKGGTSHQFPNGSE